MAKDKIQLSNMDIYEACKDLEPVLSSLWDKYGIEVCVGAMQWMSARGIIASTDLTAKQKSDLIEITKAQFVAFVKIITSNASNRSGLN